MSTETPERSRIRVVALCGSLRADSHTRKALRLALEGAAEMGAETELVDLREYDLPFATGEEDQDGDRAPADVQRLRRALGDAQGIILGTPEYHGSFTGVLKNALDLCGFDEFEGKMMGLVGVAGGALGATNALNELRGIGRALHAWVVPEQAGIPRSGKAFDAEGNLVDARLAERIRNVGREVARFAYLHSSRQWREFLETWEAAVPNPGGADR